MSKVGEMSQQPIINTPRLFLRMADPWSVVDCQELLKTYNDPDKPESRSASGIRTVDDVQEKWQRHGPRADCCTLAAPPNGMLFLVYLLSQVENSSKTEHTLIGSVMLSTRDEMPYPGTYLNIASLLEAETTRCRFQTSANLTS